MKAPWLALIHQLPPEPGYVRVKVRRRLHKLGAFALKQSVYVLPNTDEHLEDLQWLREEIIADGGSAVIAELTLLEGVTDADVKTETRRDAPRLGQTWVTRRGVKVDRIASAWLIRRFIDPKAKFRFVSPRGGTVKRTEIGFDMTGGEYTHVGNACTFETLLERFGIDEPGLRAIGEMVHDLDIKDDRFGRDQTGELKTMIEKVVESTDDDTRRLALGRDRLDAFLASLKR